MDRRPLQVRVICGGPTLLSEAVKGTNSPPLSYLFIESVAATKVLDEAGEGRLGAMLQAGMAKLNAALTPGTASDLDALLTFQAPQGGGSKAIGSLVQQAKKSNGDITQDQNWWNSLFGVFNVTDDTIKSNIVNQVQQDIGSGAEPAATEPTTEPQGDPLDDSGEAEPAPEAPPEAAPPEAAAPEAGEQDLVNQLKSERGAEQSYQDDISSQLADVRKQREANRAEIGHLRNRIEQMRNQPPKKSSGLVDPSGNPLTAESICREVAVGLLQEHTVHQHLNVVAGHLLRSLAARTNGPVRIPILNERGLGDRLRSAFGDFAANPRRTKEKLAGFAGSANNERAAKLAVQALTDHARSAFEAKLVENGLTPDQITKNLKVWSDLKALYEKNPTPKVVDAYIAASQSMKKVAELFGTASQFDVEEPVDAEVVDEPAAEEPAPVVDPRSPFAGGEDAGRSEEDAAGFRQAVSDFEAGRAGEEPQPLNNRQKAIAKAASLALNMPSDEMAKDLETNGDAAMLEMMSSDKAWPNLMANSPVMRGAVEKALQPYAAKGVNTENLPQKARVAVLKAIFAKVAG